MYANIFLGHHMLKFYIKQNGIVLAVLIILVAYINLVPIDFFSKSVPALNILNSFCDRLPFFCNLSMRTGSPTIVKSSTLLAVIGFFFAAPSYVYMFTRGKKFISVCSNNRIMAVGWIFLAIPFFPFLSIDVKQVPSRLEFLLLAASQSRFGLTLFCIFLFLGELYIFLAGAIWFKCFFFEKR